MLDLTKVIERGATRLDAAPAPDWAGAVNTVRLDTRTSRDCVLGQVFGDYHGARKRLGISVGAAYGLSLPAGYWSYPILMVWAKLNRQWVGCIERLRAARHLLAEAEELLTKAALRT